MAGELVLIVEDNERNLKLARDVLQFKGFRTLEAVDGVSERTRSAWDEFRSRYPENFSADGGIQAHIGC